MKNQRFGFLVCLLTSVAVTSALTFARVSSERDAEIRAVRDAYYAGHIDKNRAREIVGDMVESWRDPWGPQ